MKKLVIALAASIAALEGVVSSAEAADAKKVCFIYVGSRTDGGWTQAHDIGREELQKHFGDKIETPFLESVPEGPDAERAIERMARPIPEVVMGIDAFVLGAQSVNPEFKVKVVWANTWFDPGKEADAAKALIDQGVDILTQHTDTTAPMQVAAERGIKAFGQASDMIKAGPETQLTAIKDTWGAYYIKRTQALLDGTWKSESVWDGLKDGILTMAPYTNMPDDVKKMAEDTEAKIKSGELHPFTGPVKKQDGSEWLKAGEKAEDKVLLGLNFYVAGVDDKLPQ